MASRVLSSWLRRFLLRSTGIVLVLTAAGITTGSLRLSATPVEAQSSTVLFVDPPSQQTRLGSITGVDVIIQNVSDLYGAEIHLGFDPARLAVQDANPSQDGTQIEAGPLLTSGDYFIAVNRADNVQGTIDLALTQLNPTLPVSGSGAVAHIDMKALSIGTSEVSLTSALLSDRNGMTIFYATSDQLQSAASGKSTSASPIQNGSISVTANSFFVVMPFVTK